MERKFADIHVHPNLKPFNNRKYSEGQGKTIWDKFDERKKDLKKLCFIIRAKAKELAKSSQANLDACVEAKLVCPFLSLYPVERQWFDAQSKNIIFRIVLPKRKYHHLGAAISGFPTEFVKKIMLRIKKNEGIDYFNDELLPNMDYTLDQMKRKSTKYPNWSFKIATDYNEFKQYTNSNNTICGILTIEGGNSLGNYYSHKTFYKEYKDLNPIEKYYLKKDFINNVNTLKSYKSGRYTPLFISFCHHFNNLLAGHSRSLAAFGGLLNQEPGLNKGFNKLGKKILKLLLSRENGRRILIDTKHMSIYSRFYYHQLVRERREQRGDSIPIIQSHAAINGLESFLKALDCDEDRKDFNGNAYFSQWKMNLNDEEILDIYDSDGIIGIVLHEDKMPGGKVKAQTKELSNRYHKLEKKKHLSYQQQKEFDDIKGKLKLIYVRLIWSNIFHIIKLIYDNRNHENGWKIISIGSDYDGMIDPFDGYYSVSDLPALFNDMADYMNKGRGPVYYADNGNIFEFQRNEIATLMFGKKIEDILSDICFNNVDIFLSKYFTNRYLTKQSPVNIQSPRQSSVMVKKQSSRRSSAMVKK